MRSEPHVTPDAQADILEAARYYEGERAGLGFAFLDAIERALASIRDNPLLFTLVDEPVRRVLLQQYPYGVFYEPGDQQDTVLAVMDLRQDPETIRRSYRR
jgi:plasmid stabilization system protein ParE